MKMLLENIKLFLFLQPLQGNTERCLSGRKERFAKPSYGLNCIEGSNPSLSAEIKSLQVVRFEGFFHLSISSAVYPLPYRTINFIDFSFRL